MTRLLQIEWLKLRHYRPFWVLIGMYALGVVVVCGSGMFFMQYLKSKGADFEGIDPTMLPLYDYPDVWQNVTYMAAFFKVFLAFIVIISVANEVSYRTLRQNVIDGLSKREFLGSKLLFIFFLSLAATGLVILIVFVTASAYSNVQGFDYMFESMEFALAYLFGVFTYLTFALLITLLIPKTGLVIVALFMYTVVFEPLLAIFLLNFPNLADWARAIAPWMPVTSVYNLIDVPFPRYLLMEIQNYVSLRQVGIVSVWLLFNISMSYLLLKRKDW